MLNPSRSPRARVALAAMLGTLTLAMLLACGFAEGVQEGFNEGMQQGFETECTNECALGVERATCVTYCSCAWTWANDNDRLAELNTATGDGTSQVERDLMVACGADLWDSEFLRGCRGECGGDPACEARCACYLREIRGPGPRDESTAWILANISETPTPAGEARMEAAGTVCDAQ